ncbi:hypothetical protein [Microbacterium sp.]|uniref:hypothetical protein n=1 Tax=Microbacterium sp. TaxID=51671 RepID=UPI003A93275B
MKYCPQCSAARAADTKFCSECGYAFEGGFWSQTANNNRGSTIIQAGPGAIVQPPTEPKKITMETRWAWNSPLTQSALTWIGVVLSTASLLPLGRMVAPIFALLDGTIPEPPVAASFWWYVGFVTLIVLAVIAWSGARVVRRRQIRPLDRFGLLPAAWGHDGRLGLARLHGVCPECRGRLDLKNLATEVKIVDGKERPSRWEPYCVCASNPQQHNWPFDMTATVEIDDSEKAVP